MGRCFPREVAASLTLTHALSKASWDGRLRLPCPAEEYNLLSDSAALLPLCSCEHRLTSWPQTLPWPLSDRFT